ncbi:hypothetical protein NC652_020284 [Populus alba x Populus x berolinensis]|nr:hypothetical protein NC652_020284 [Populus alba x Populus x berolinensis]
MEGVPPEDLAAVGTTDVIMRIGVADEYIGLVVGRGGRNIMEIIPNSGARIKISDRGGFMSGTNEGHGKAF